MNRTSGAFTRPGQKLEREVSGGQGQPCRHAEIDAMATIDSAPLSFGIFDWLDRSSLDLADLYEQRLQMLEYADKAGFYCYHLAEHHGTPLNIAPSPNIFLAAAAQRTRRIRLGPMVYLLPLYNPLRLIEEICMLDHLSRGRLEVGIGRGVSPYELAMFNVDSRESRAIFHEALDIITTGLRTGSIAHSGRYFSFKEARVPLRPLQQPYPPLWYPTSNPESVPWAAQHGFGIIGIYGSLAELGERFELYKRVWHEHRHDPHRLNGHVPEPKVGLARVVYVAESDYQALREVKAAFADYFASFNYLWALNGARQFEYLADFEAGMERGINIAGSPVTVRARIEEQVQVTGCNYFLGAFAFGTLSTEQILNSLRLFAEEVMPAFRPAYQRP